MAREVLDAAVVQQFKQYLKDKNKIFENLTPNELEAESKKFLQVSKLTISLFV